MSESRSWPCLECGEEIDLELFPDDDGPAWFVQVAHIHGREQIGDQNATKLGPGRWSVQVFKHKQGSRWQPGVKLVHEIVTAQSKAARAEKTSARRVQKAGA